VASTTTSTRGTPRDGGVVKARTRCSRGCGATFGNRSGRLPCAQWGGWGNSPRTPWWQPMLRHRPEGVRVTEGKPLEEKQALLRGWCSITSALVAGIRQRCQAQCRRDGRASFTVGRHVGVHCPRGRALSTVAPRAATARPAPTPPMHGHPPRSVHTPTPRAITPPRHPHPHPPPALLLQPHCFG